MPSRDTVISRITNETVKEIDRIRNVMANELGIDIRKVTRRNAETVLRLKATRGKVMKNELNDIFMGRIK